MRLHQIQQTLLITRDLAHARAVYCGAFALRAGESSEISSAWANALGAAELVGARYCDFFTADCPTTTEAAFLRVIEYLPAHPTPAFSQLGWLASEWLVSDVDALYTKLIQQFESGALRLLQPPKDLAISDAIRAMQIQGPCDEVIYLTQVKRALMPFRLPISVAGAQTVGPAFVAVLACQDRALSAAFYQGLGGGHSLKFQTRLGALNLALGRDESLEYPLATVQLQGDALLEMDQLAFLPTTVNAEIRCGIFAFAFSRVGTRGQAGPERVLRGPDQERILLT